MALNKRSPHSFMASLDIARLSTFQVLPAPTPWSFRDIFTAFCGASGSTWLVVEQARQSYHQAGVCAYLLIYTYFILEAFKVYGKKQIQ
jgi:hypothetical protein